MKRVLLAAGAVMILAAPAFADEQVTIEKRSVTTTRPVPEAGSTVSTVIVAPNPPPPPRAEVPPPAPGPAMVWMEGHWSWNPETHGYVWISGKYAEPPRAHAAWAPGHWAKRPEGWVWADGHWD